MAKIILPDLTEVIATSGINTVIVGRHAKAELDESDPEAVVRYSLKQDDPDLSDEGRGAAEASRELFLSLVGDVPFVCVSSPLKRAWKTVNILAPTAKLYCDDRLEAADYEHLPDTIRAWARKELSTYATHRLWRASPGFASTLERVGGAVISLLENYEESTVVVMSHMEICSLVICLLLGAMPQRFLEPYLQVPRGKFSALVRGPEDEWFSTSWLPDESAMLRL